MFKAQAEPALEDLLRCNIGGLMALVFITQFRLDWTFSLHSGFCLTLIELSFIPEEM